MTVVTLVLCSIFSFIAGFIVGVIASTSRAFEGKDYMAQRGKFAGPSILELMERELDKAVKDLETAKLSNLYADGRVMGLAAGIAIMRNPYSYLGMKPAQDFDTLVQSVINASETRVANRLPTV